ncbi:FHA domain-containing protein [Cellulomonas sp.]|uniref:FHA domain-containing protein n=1 Tax=Cellulomonas sp. TaxID=40001 RepID=UPI001B123810|nr:FHA domain-containing protein [Cellulomonas sp.]MBO9555221.1 FHA domain-containing protein [Cellulomonas sp.]
MTVPEYTTGDRTAVVRPGFVALVGPGVDDDAVRALWDAAGDGVVGALAVLARDGLTGLPSFALVAVTGRRVHVALRGDVEVVLTGESDQVLHAGEVSTWSERTVDGVAEVSLRVSGVEADGSALPVTDGVVRAAEVWVALEDVEVPPVVDDAPVAALPAVPAAPAVVVAPAVIDVPVLDAPALDVPVLDAPVPDGPQLDVPELDVPGPDRPTVPEDEEAAGVALVDASAPAEEESPVEDLRADEPAEPVQDPEPDVADEPEPVSSWSGETDPTGDDDVPAAGDELLDDGPGAADLAEVVAAAESFLAGPRHAAPHRVIDVPDALDVPRAAEPTAAAPTAEPTLGAASADDHDGLTILSSDLAAIRDQLPSWASDEVPGPFAVPAAVEPARIVLSTGLVVSLDRAVLLGRAPQVARVTNRELPRLVTVPSPQQDISRTHAEVRAEGDHVLVTDLDSTNGVHVSRPGEGARRLHPGEASVVGAGEVVDLGDGVTFTVERGS